MAQAARAYDYYTYGSAAPQRQPRRQERPDVRVVPGKNRSAERQKGLSANAVFSFKTVIVLACVLACVFAARVWLSVATVQSMQAIEALEADVSVAQAAGNDLEIQHSVLASPERIAREATAMGMVQPEYVEHIAVALPPRAMTLPNGSISLALTIDSVENAAAGLA